MIKRFKVYGQHGHRQKESFASSKAFKTWDNISIAIANFDITGTHDFSIVTIIAATEEEINKALQGQITDGIFENCKIGKIEEDFSK